MVPLVSAWVLLWIHNSRQGPVGALGELGEMIDKLIEAATDAYIIVVAASMLMVAFSRERDEDEYTTSVRGRCLMLAFYVDFVFVFVTTLTVYSLEYLNIMAAQMFMVLFLHIVMFNTAMAIIRRRRGYEE
jgi:hypothetical protein